MLQFLLFFTFDVFSLASSITGYRPRRSESCIICFEVFEISSTKFKFKLETVIYWVYMYMPIMSSDNRLWMEQQVVDYDNYIVLTMSTLTLIICCSIHFIVVNIMLNNLATFLSLIFLFIKKSSAVISINQSIKKSLNDQCLKFKWRILHSFWCVHRLPCYSCVFL